jgi:hypothetical protein
VFVESCGNVVEGVLVLSDKDKPSRSVPGAMPAGFIQPQLGFNNNVRYRGVVFHIQTEDSGMHRPHVTTHLFADGGRVIKSQRTDYSELIKLTDFTIQLRLLMKEQHRAMFTSLRNGTLDELLTGISLAARPSIAPASEAGSEKYLSISPSLPPAGASRGKAVAPPPNVPAVPRKREPALGAPKDLETRSATGAVAEPALPRAELVPGVEAAPANSVASLSPPSSEGGALPSSRGRAPRPSAVFDFAPDSGRLFGSASARDASIDEAILNYLAGESRLGG